MDVSQSRCILCHIQLHPKSSSMSKKEVGSMLGRDGEGPTFRSCSLYMLVAREAMMEQEAGSKSAVVAVTVSVERV